MAPRDQGLYTAEQFARMRFESPAELARGVVVELPHMGVRHGVVCGNVSGTLTEWARRSGIGIVACGGLGIITKRNPDTVRGPDVIFDAHDRNTEIQAPDRFLDVAPNLVVEVMSTHDTWRSMLTRVSEYLGAGVQEAWVLDPHSRNVHSFLPDKPPAVIRAGTRLESSSVLVGFSAEIDSFFEGA